MLALVASVWIGAFANWPLWHALTALPEMATSRGGVFVAGCFVIVTAVTFALLAPFAWGRSIKPALSVFLLVAAVGAHFMGAYGIVIDSTMVRNVIQSDVREARDLISTPLLGHVLGLAVLPLIWLQRVNTTSRGCWRQLRLNALGIAGALVVTIALGLALFADLSATMRNHRSMRYLINPVNSFYALGTLAYGSTAKGKGPLLPIGLDAHIAVRTPGAKPPLLLLVIGETARAQNFALNGYARPTTPELQRLGVTSFRNARSCGTSTAASLPCMFSHLGREGFNARTADYEDLVDLLQRAGLAVLWLDNQSGCKTLCDRVPHAAASATATGAAPLPAGLCRDGECFDGALLHGLDHRLDALPSERRDRGVVLVLHQMGSHGPAYALRSPPDRKPFLPECTTNVLQQCDGQQLMNAYDNSIAYTDHVLAGGIAWLKKHVGDYDPSFIYVSDHGESLGENSLYLHGVPYAIAPTVQTHVPFIVWSPARQGEHASSLQACLESKRDVPLSHDNLFHTVLGMLGVTAAEYRPERDISASCKTHA